eukprot:6114367-Prorocentrum_lima.AAC.1
MDLQGNRCARPGLLLLDSEHRLQAICVSSSAGIRRVPRAERLSTEGLDMGGRGGDTIGQGGGGPGHEEG